ncbi:MAG: glycosyltransferase family 4 protein [Caldilineaceae bacterium]
MKITIPVHHFPPQYSSGAELYSYRLARALRRRGHDAQVVTIEAIDQGAPDQLSVAQDVYDGIPVWRLSFDIFRSPQRRIWDFDNALIGAWFADYLKQEQPDLIHLQAGYLIGVAPVNAATAANVPLVLTLHDFWYLCPRHTLQRGDGSLCTQIPASPAGCVWCRKLEQKRYQLADQLSGGIAGQVMQNLALKDETAIVAERRSRLSEALRHVDAVIAPSQFMADQFAQDVAADRMHVLRYGLAPFQPAQTQRSHSGDTLHIGYTGQIAPHKGVHLLVKAFRNLRTQARAAQLHIYGGLESYPEYVTHLRKLAADDPRIHLHGRFAGAQLPEVLATLDVVVVPSTWYENSPFAIMEAHAAGLPVITAALGGMAELVRHEVDGLHFQAGDAQDLAIQLQRMLDDADLAPQLAQRIQPPMSIDAEVDRLLEIYSGVQPVAQANVVCGHGLAETRIFLH